MRQHTLVNGACTEASAHEQHGLSAICEAKGTQRFLPSDRRVEQGLPHRITGEHDFVCREEALHALIGYTYLGSLLG